MAYKDDSIAELRAVVDDLKKTISLEMNRDRAGHCTITHYRAMCT